MLCVNATELYNSMLSELPKVVSRTADDGALLEPTVEAVGKSFVLTNIEHNIIANRSIDLTWAAANALHFFTGSDDAKSLPRYNERAAIYAPDGVWVGAYGTIAMPQIHLCIEKLRRVPQTRRAVVNMAGLEHEDINRPHCWNVLHFLAVDHERLDMLVYQRSLNLPFVMPYDVIVLTNVLNYVAASVHMSPGRLHWIIGSLHAPAKYIHSVRHAQRNLSLMLPSYEVEWCEGALNSPETVEDERFRELLTRRIRS